MGEKMKINKYARKTREKCTFEKQVVNFCAFVCKNTKK